MAEKDPRNLAAPAYGVAKLPRIRATVIKGRLVSNDLTPELAELSEAADMQEFDIQVLLDDMVNPLLAMGEGIGQFGTQQRAAGSIKVDKEHQRPTNFTREFNLAGRLPEGTSLLKGKDLGKSIRDEWKLDQIDKTILQNQETVQIHIPDEVLSLTDEFFEGLLGPTVNKLKYFFKHHYFFDCDPSLGRLVEQNLRRYERLSL